MELLGFHFALLQRTDKVPQNNALQRTPHPAPLRSTLDLKEKYTNSRIRGAIIIASFLAMPLLTVACRGLGNSGAPHSREITTEYMENVLAKLGGQVDREKVANESSSQSKVSNRVMRIRGVTLQGAHVTDATLDQMKGFTFESLMLYQTSVTDEGLAKLKHLPNLKKLFLRTMHIAGPGLAYLQDLASLRYLELHSAPITDDLLAHLESMKNLEGVSLEMREKITDAGLTHLKGLTNLRKLNLYGTQVSDEGLKLLGRLTNLEELNLSHTGVTDAGLAHLNTFGHLKSLSLIRHFNGTRISDAGLAHLTDLKTLERLELHGTQVTDRGMKYLATLKSLRHVGLALTGVGGNGLAELKELPNLQSLSLSSHQAYSGLRHLKQMGNLSRLTLFGLLPDDPVLQEIQDVLPDCSIGIIK